MKGITPIIAIIVLLLIVVALAGSAYTFLFGQFSAYTSHTIEARFAASNSLIIKNSGTATVQPEDLSITIDGRDVTVRNPQPIPVGESVIYNIIPYEAAANKKIRISSPTNTIELNADTTGGIYNGLVLLHHADADASDSSLYSNDGTLIPGASINASGCIGGTYQFDGIAGNVTIPYHDSLGAAENNGTFSIFMWINPSDTNPSQILFVQNTDKSFLTYIFSGNFYTFYDGFQTLPLAVVSSGVWSHVGLVHNGTHFIGYLDGSQVSLVPRTNATITSNDVFVIGDGTYLGTHFEYEGSIDEIGFWGRPLTPGEIQDLYQQGVDAGCV